MGLPAVRRDSQDKRRKLYGQAGRFRPTSYGIEYRTLSNYWTFGWDLTYEVGVNTYELMDYIDTAGMDKIQSAFQSIPWNDVQSAINNQDRKLAERLRRYIRNDIMGV